MVCRLLKNKDTYTFIALAEPIPALVLLSLAWKSR
jgi:hypothetical protein